MRVRQLDECAAELLWPPASASASASASSTCVSARLGVRVHVASGDLSPGEQSAAFTLRVDTYQEAAEQKQKQKPSALHVHSAACRIKVCASWLRALLVL